jgi:hypothetical protein
MRIFLACTDDDGSRRTLRILLDNCTSTGGLLREISREMGVARNYLIVSLKYDPYNVRTLPSSYESSIIGPSNTTPSATAPPSSSNLMIVSLAATSAFPQNLWQGYRRKTTSIRPMSSRRG